MRSIPQFVAYILVYVYSLRMLLFARPITCNENKLINTVFVQSNQSPCGLAVKVIHARTHTVHTHTHAHTHWHTCVMPTAPGYTLWPILYSNTWRKYDDTHSLSCVLCAQLFILQPSKKYDHQKIHIRKQAWKKLYKGFITLAHGRTYRMPV